MSPIATIYEEPKETKPYRSARPEPDDGSVLETLFLEDLDVTKSANSYAPWHQAADALLLGACLGEVQHMTTGLSGIHGRLRSLLGVLMHGDQDPVSRCIPRAPQVFLGHDGQAEAPVPCIEDLIRQIEEARP